MRLLRVVMVAIALTLVSGTIASAESFEEFQQTATELAEDVGHTLFEATESPQDDMLRQELETAVADALTTLTDVTIEDCYADYYTMVRGSYLALEGWLRNARLGDANLSNAYWLVGNDPALWSQTYLDSKIACEAINGPTLSPNPPVTA